MKDIGEPPVLRRQVRLQVVTGFLVPLRVTHSESVSRMFLLILNNLKKKLMKRFAITHINTAGK